MSVENKTDEGTITVCVGNYGYYNEGELRDRWLSLPKTNEQIKAFLEENGLQDAMHEETYISDYDGLPFPCPSLFNEHTPLSELNLLAKALECYEDECETVMKALDCCIDSPSSLSGLMNWILQADDIDIIPYSCAGSSDEERLGRTLADIDGLAEKLDELDLEIYFDYEAYGRDCGINLLYGSEGYMYYGTEMPAEDYYDLVELAEEIEETWDMQQSFLRKAREAAERGPSLAQLGESAIEMADAAARGADPGARGIGSDKEGHDGHGDDQEAPFHVH